MKDPLQQVLAAEAEARDRIEQTRLLLESELRAARVDAQRIKARNERRTRVAVEEAERRGAAATERRIEGMEEEVNRQLDLDDAVVERRLEDLVKRQVDELWPRNVELVNKEGT